MGYKQRIHFCSHTDNRKSRCKYIMRGLKHIDILYSLPNYIDSHSTVTLIKLFQFRQVSTKTGMRMGNLYTLISFHTPLVIRMLTHGFYYQISLSFRYDIRSQYIFKTNTNLNKKKQKSYINSNAYFVKNLLHYVCVS